MAILPISSWRKQVYIAKKLDSVKDSKGNQRQVYATPIAYEINVQPLRDDARIEMFGANSRKMFRAIIHGVNHDINDFDVVYLEGATPTGEINNGDNSNYIVRRSSKQNVVTMLYFESIKG